ncbi:hypothetical protein [Stutzerimonas stutzeri]|nr:hypothetical protein [Stutzerimonas stutzeri]
MRFDLIKVVVDVRADLHGPGVSSGLNSSPGTSIRIPPSRH